MIELVPRSDLDRSLAWWSESVWDVDSFHTRPSTKRPGIEVGRLYFASTKGVTGVPLGPAARVFEHHSVREFSNVEVSRVDVASVCAAIIGSNDALPYRSAGALYPVHLLVVRRLGSDNWEVGYVHPVDREVQWFIERQDSDLSGVWVDQWGYGATVAFVLIADLSRISSKYGIRGARFAALEAGALAGLLGAGAAGIGLGSCRMGGYHDGLLLDLLAVSAARFVVADVLLAGWPLASSRLEDMQ